MKNEIKYLLYYSHFPKFRQAKPLFFLVIVDNLLINTIIPTFT